MQKSPAHDCVRDSINPRMLEAQDLSEDQNLPQHVILPLNDDSSSAVVLPLEDDMEDFLASCNIMLLFLNILIL